MVCIITVGNCGIDSNHQKPLASFHPKSVDYTLLLVKTDAYFVIDEKTWNTLPNTVILYKKNAVIRYGRHIPHYNDDWVHFDFEPEDEAFISSLNIPYNAPRRLYGFENLTEYTRLITLEKNATKSHRQYILDSLMRTLLYTLSSLIHMDSDERLVHKHYEAFLEIRNAIRNAPHKEWTVESMAKQVHISPSYFQHLYKSLFDVSCMQEVIAARVKRARYYLRSSDVSVSQLAELCGYTNEIHFMRQFKKVEGVTPSQYRKLNHK